MLNKILTVLLLVWFWSMCAFFGYNLGKTEANIIKYEQMIK